MAGVNFSLDAAQRIVAAVKKIERTPTDLTGQPNPSRDPGTSFWAIITGAANINAQFFDWVKCEPNALTMGAAMDSNTVAPSNVWKFSDPYVAGSGNAREVNNCQSIPPGTVVLMTFVGYAFPLNTTVNPGTNTQAASTNAPPTPADGTIPMYVFNYAMQPPQPNDIRLHDHRDNLTGGGFAFSVYHPGTALPQQPWSV